MKKKILLILVEPPLPFGNAASRWFYVLVKELRERGHELDILVASDVPQDIEKAKNVFANDKNFSIFSFATSKGMLGKLKTFLYPQKNHFSDDFLKCLLNKNPQTYDIIHVEQTWGGWSALPWTDKTLLNVHHLQTIDLAQVKAATWKQKLLYARWFATEKRLISKYPYVRSCSPRLVPYIKAWGTKRQVRVVPVGIDTTLYPYIKTESRRVGVPIVSVIGNMGWYPSVSAAERLLNNLWPSISEQVPTAKIQIVGWGARTALSKYLNHKNVEIIENVPDIKPFFESASVMVYAPQRGSGMKIKILESLAFGVPVVTTSEGAEGLPAVDHLHMGLCDDDKGLIDRTVKVLTSVELQEKWRVHGRKLVEEHCSPQSTVNQIEDFYDFILNDKARP